MAEHVPRGYGRLVDEEAGSGQRNEMEEQLRAKYRRCVAMEAEDVEGGKEALIEWMLMNNEDVLVEEGEDILDGLEIMENDHEMPTFQKDGMKISSNTKSITRINRANSMIKIREELMKKKELRKPSASRVVREEDFEDLEVRRMERKASSKVARGVLASDVDNKVIQDRGAKIQVVGSDVEALYPSLDAVEVAQIVYNAMLKTDVKFKGVNYQEACRMIALTSSEQECRLGPLKRVLPVRRYKNGTRPGISGEDPLGPDVGCQEQWKFPNLKRKPLTSEEKKSINKNTLFFISSNE